MKQARAITLFLVFGACALLAYWRSQSPQSTGGPEPSQITAAQCDQSLWQHVYDPRPLHAFAPCVSGTGTAAENRQETDGDGPLLFRLHQGVPSPPPTNN